MTRRAPVADDSKPELYDETGAGAHDGGKPSALTRLSLHHKGWRKDAHGNGFLCPYASCKTAGDVHTRLHHDRWHQDVIDDFKGVYELVDELRGEMAAHLEMARHQDEVIAGQQHQIDTLGKVLDQLTARGAYAIVEQVLADRSEGK